MEKYKSKKELNLFKLWGIKKINNAHSNRTLEKISPIISGTGGVCSDDDDEGGLPESGDDDDMISQKRFGSGRNVSKGHNVTSEKQPLIN